MPSTMTHGRSSAPSTAYQPASPAELALVQTVGAALSALEVALRAANPRAGEEVHAWEPPADLRGRVAEGVIRQGRRLRTLLERYQALTFLAPRPWEPRSGRCRADGHLHVPWPRMSAEQACLLGEVLTLFSAAVRDEHAGELADLAARRAERATWEDADAADEDEDLPF